MKKSFFFALVTVAAMVCVVSCDKDNSSGSPNDSDIIGTSYWTAECSDGTFYLGLVELPDGRYFAIAVFVSDAASTMQECEEFIALAAEAVYEYMAEERIKG